MDKLFPKSCTLFVCLCCSYRLSATLDPNSKRGISLNPTSPRWDLAASGLVIMLPARPGFWPPVQEVDLVGATLTHATQNLGVSNGVSNGFSNEFSNGFSNGVSYFKILQVANPKKDRNVQSSLDHFEDCELAIRVSCAVESKQ